MDNQPIRKKSKGSDLGQNSISNWAVLVPELLELIFKRLILSDQVRCSSICKPWHSLANKKSCPPAREPPWLMLLNLKHHYEFFSLRENRVFKVNKKVFSGSRGIVRGSSNGWLVIELAVGHRFYLLNPFSEVKFELPHHLTFPFLIHPLYVSVIGKALDDQSYNRLGDIEKAIVFSCGQQQYCNMNDPEKAIVVVLSVFGFMAFCKVVDKAWRAPQHWYRTYDDVLFYNGELYAVNRTGLIDVISVDDDALSFPIVKTISHVPRIEKYSSMYLVECCGELLLVRRYYQSSEGPTTGFEVLKLILGHSPPQYLKMNSLGNQVLFLGINNSVSFAAENSLEFKGNHIYFTENDSNGSGDFGVFSLEDGKVKPFPSPVCNLQLVRPIWVTPVPFMKE